MVKHGVFNLADRFRGFTVSILEGFGSFHQKKVLKIIRKSKNSSSCIRSHTP